VFHLSGADRRVMPSFWKQPRGSYLLERDKARAAAEKIEREEKAKVRKRDGRCRWPIQHKCRGGLEAAHIRDASLGGDMRSSNLITLCSWLHRRGPESVHGKQLQVVPLTSAGADGPVSFWRKDEDGKPYMCAQESAVGILERD